MKSSVLFSFALTAMLLPATGRSAYPSLAMAEFMFSPERLNSWENRQRNSQYDDFALRLGEPAAPDQILEVETAIL